MSDKAPPIAAPLPDVRTERLDLRRFSETDGPELAAVFAQREVWQFPFGRALTTDETLAFLSHQIKEWDSLGLRFPRKSRHGLCSWVEASQR